MAISYFDEIFFSTFIKQDDDEVLDICHKHIVTIIDTIIIWIFFYVILPAFFYYNNTFKLQDTIPFLYFEAYLISAYIYMTYKIFDWYNDVWIITDKWIIDLDWQLMKTNVVYIDYNDVKWIEIHQNSSFDWLLNKWEIQIHLQWEWTSFWLSDAKNPWSIVWYIQEILDEKEKKKKDKDKSMTDKLFDTLRSVIKEHLEKEQNPQSDTEENENTEEKEVSKVLKRKWTIDLR